jgi:2-polyprenyl-3-methyl-5-hydroxy-6-metoxy-1,4-benzoquinol methylase
MPKLPTSNFVSPRTFAASYTADFIDSSFPELAKNLLDVGCGDGLVTRQLQLRGYNVAAIDASLKGVDRANRNGVKAIHCNLEDYVHAPFDGIYMSRTLHHMPPLEQTLIKVKELLSANGTLVIEDFGFDLADEASCAWLFEQSGKVIAAQTEPVRCEFHHEWLHEQIESPSEAFARWQKRYAIEHQLWSAEQMLSALREHFVLISQSRVPYLFRFICDLLPDSADGAAQAHMVLLNEQNKIDEKIIAPVGLRVVVTKI